MAGLDVVKLQDLNGFLNNLQRAIITQDSSFLLQKRGLKVDRLVGIEEFAESAEYMNQGGYVRPAIKKKLIELFESEQFVEAVLTGAIGIGKNYYADMAISYMLYTLSAYHNPQLEFDLAPGSSIVFIMQSKTLTLAKKVVFDQFSARLKLSPYFTQNFMFDTYVKSELRFPQNIYVIPVGGSDTSALGMNVYGGIIDEMNFMARIRDSIQTRYTHEEEYDQAERLYTTLIRRMKSRFMQKGRLPGKLLLVSSVNYPDDFTGRKLVEAETDPTIFVMKMSQWEALPADRFCGEVFLVEVGNEFRRSRLLDTYEEADESESVIEVPTEYKADFERDLEAALRDYAGITTGTKHAFIPYRELIVQAQETYKDVTSGLNLFRYETIVFEDLFSDGIVEWERLVNIDYFEEVLLDRRQVFAAHVDVGLTNDAAGLAIGRLAGYKLLPATKYYDERRGEFIEIRDIRAPIYMIDGILQIRAPRGGEVDLGQVRDLLLWFRGEINLKWGTADSYQSAMLLQALRKARIRSGVLSVDSSPAPYTETKLAIKDQRVIMQPHGVASKELRELEAEGEKIDHPPGGSKDCSDAIAGVIHMLMRKEAKFGRPVSGRRRGRSRSTKTDEDQVRKVRIGARRRVRGGSIR